MSEASRETAPEPGARPQTGASQTALEALPPPEAPGGAPGKSLSAAAVRALNEAAERRAAREEEASASESGGPKGPEPTRYGDWERKGVAIDF